MNSFRGALRCTNIVRDIFCKKTESVVASTRVAWKSVICKRRWSCFFSVCPRVCLTTTFYIIDFFSNLLLFTLQACMSFCASFLCSTKYALFKSIALESLWSYLPNGACRSHITSILTKLWPIPLTLNRNFHTAARQSASSQSAF